MKCHGERTRADPRPLCQTQRQPGPRLRARQHGGHGGVQGPHGLRQEEATSEGIACTGRSRLKGRGAFGPDGDGAADWEEEKEEEEDAAAIDTEHF